MESMPHMNYVHAGQYWLTQALRNASGVLTDNIDEACLVWVDMYCYNQASSSVCNVHCWNVQSTVCCCVLFV